MKFTRRILWALCLVTWAHGKDIIETSTVEPIENAIKQCGKNTLVIWDVDEVLIFPHDAVLQSPNRKGLASVGEGILTKHDDPDVQDMLGTIYQKRKYNHVDSEIVKVVSKSQAKGVRHLAFTSHYRGPLGPINSLEEWRFGELKKLDYNFENSWQDLTEINFENLPAKHERFPGFKKGVLYGCELDKGIVLKEFLGYIKESKKIEFSDIIFVDDQLKNLESVKKFTIENNIEFKGFHYTAAMGKAKSFNQAVAELQVTQVVQKRNWLSDSQTRVNEEN